VRVEELKRDASEQLHETPDEREGGGGRGERGKRGERKEGD